MRNAIALALIVLLLGCAHNGVTGGEQTREYSKTTVSLSDFSMKIIGYYQSENRTVPGDFDTNQFFTLLEKIYPDQPRVKSIKDNYKISVRPLEGGYSIMLCDPKTGLKIMEDLSCHVNRVEIRSWEKDVNAACVFETNWKEYCK